MSNKAECGLWYQQLYYRKMYQSIGVVAFGFELVFQFNENCSNVVQLVVYGDGESIKMRLI